MEKFVYTFREGESMADVARKFGVPERELVLENAVTCAAYRGMKIIVTKRTGVYHITGPFETLASIAGKYGVDEDELAAWNGKTVYIGQKLFIPERTDNRDGRGSF